MKSKSTFTIVSRAGSERPNAKGLEKVAKDSLLLALKSTKTTQSLPDFDKLPPAVVEALLSNAEVAVSRRGSPTAAKKKSSSTAAKSRSPTAGEFEATTTGKRPASKTMTRARGASSPLAMTSEYAGVIRRIAEAQDTPTQTVGVLDLGAWVSRLPELLELINGVQTRYTFLEVQTPVPAGLIKTKEPMVTWVQQHSKRPLKPQLLDDIVRNMLADDFLYFATSVRDQNKLDYLFGLTPAMVAFLEDGMPHWNYFAWASGEIAVLSTADLREYAHEAGRPYEAAVGMLLISQAIGQACGMHRHEEKHECIFDFNADRVGLIDSIREMKIHRECLEALASHGQMDLDAAQAVTQILSRMKEGKPWPKLRS